jgi:hypothetical protein
VRTGCHFGFELRRVNIELTRDNGSEDGTDTSEDGDEDVGDSLHVSEVLACDRYWEIGKGWRYGIAEGGEVARPPSKDGSVTEGKETYLNEGRQSASDSRDDVTHVD